MRFGILTSSLGATQLAYCLIKFAERANQLTPPVDLIVFTEETTRTWEKPRCTLMNVCEAYDYDGILIATSLDTAAKLRRMPGPAKRYFFVWDLEWISVSVQEAQQPRFYEEMASLYQDPSLTLIARSQYHADLIKNCWNRDYVIVGRDFEEAVDWLQRAAEITETNQI